MHIANDPDPAPTPLQYWRVLREFISQTWSLFGSPLDIARQYWMHKKDARLLRDWLFPLEQALRRLLFIDIIAEPALITSQDHAPQDKSSPSKPRTRQRAPRPDSFNLDDSETWRVSFNLNLRRHTSRNPTRNPRTPPLYDPGITGTHTYALRLEALLRGFNNPEPLKARLRRLLARDRARLCAYLAPVRKHEESKPAFAQLIDITKMLIDRLSEAACGPPLLNPPP